MISFCCLGCFIFEYFWHCKQNQTYQNIFVALVAQAKLVFVGK